MTFCDIILIHFKHQVNHCHVMVKTYYKKEIISSTAKQNR